MGSVRLIYQQRTSIPMANPGNGPDIRTNSLIGGRSHKNRLDFRIRSQGFFHIAGENSSVYPQIFYLRGIKINSSKSPQLRCMICAAVAVARHKKGASLAGTAKNSA